MRLYRLLTIIAISLAGLACFTDNPLISRDRSNIALSIDLPRGERSLETGLAKAVTVTSVTLTVTADDMDDIEEALTISGSTASGTVEVPKGEDRVFSVICEDQNGVIQYSGSDTTDIKNDEETVTITTEGHYPSISTLSITNFNAESVSLSWTQNADVDFLAYELVRAETAGDLAYSSTRESITTIYNKTTTTYTDTSVVSLTTYYYAVIVWDTEGLGMRSYSQEVRVPDYEQFSATGPWFLSDTTWTDRYFLNNSFAPSGATVVLVEYRLRISYYDYDYNFYCGDYEIYLSSSTSTGTSPDVLVYDNLGGGTDGGYDDDVEDDSDIYLNWRSTNYFNGESANQYWGVYIVDTAPLDYGQLDYLDLIIQYVTPSLSPGMVTLRIPGVAIVIDKLAEPNEGVSLGGQSASTSTPNASQPVSVGATKEKALSGR